MSRVVFLGSKASGLAALERLATAVKPPHTLVGALFVDDAGDARSITQQLEAFARASGLPSAVARGAEGERALDAWRPDVALVVGWYRIIDLTRHPGIQFFGMHYSPLPRYRGSAPAVWQILRGETELGVTLFRFAAGLDNGDVAGSAVVNCGPDETIGDVLPRLDEAALDLMDREIPAILGGRARLTPQRDADATYCGRRVAADGVIDWSAPARRVHDFIRSQSRPYPGAFTHLEDGRLLRVWRTVREPRRWIGVPGSIVARDPSGAIVACGDGALRLVDVECAEGATMAPTLRGVRRLGRAVL